uniref:Chaperone protein dnaj 13-like n=1 Tax=Tetraselmis sp. GSL018 TaxID=582737 RepID=A0A061QLV6_9CHLO
MWRHSGLRKAFPEEEDGLGSSEDEVELPADSTDLYAVLNLPRDASDDDVQRAYRTLARTFHPDKHQDDNLKQDASESFARLNEAYSILSDPQTRQIYDIYGMEDSDAPDI